MTPSTASSSRVLTQHAARNNRLEHQPLSRRFADAHADLVGEDAAGLPST